MTAPRHAARPRFAAAAGIATAVMLLVAGTTAIGTSVALVTSVASFGQPSRLVLVAKAPASRRAGAPTTVALAPGVMNDVTK